MYNPINSKMKNLFFVVFCITMSFTVQGQISASVQKAIYYQDFSSAKMNLQKDIKSNPNNLDNYFELGALYARLNKVDSAGIIFGKLAEMNPKAAVTTVANGYVLLNSGKADEAKAMFEKAAKSTKFKDGSIMRRIGEAYLYSPKTNLDEAIEYLKKAVAIEIKNPVTYYSLGEAYYLKKEGGPAVTNYEFCTDYDKSAAWAYTRIGQIFEGVKNYVKANEAYQAALSADPDYPFIYKEMANWLYLRRDYKAAMNNFIKYQQLTGDNSIEAKTQKSTYAFYNKDYKQTLELVNDIMKVDSSKNYMIRLLGYSSFEQGDSLSAKNYMEKFFQKTNKDKIIWSDYYYLGKINEKFNNDTEALVNFKKAIELDSNQVDVYDAIAKMYFANENYKEAGYWYGLKLNKLDNPKIQEMFDPAFAYYRSEDWANANTFFGKLVTRYPTSVAGQLYYARTNSLLDPKATNGLAKPIYEKVAELGEKDPVKYKNELKEAYNYLYYFYYNGNDKTKAFEFADKFTKVDPNDPDGAKLLEAVKQ